MYKVLTSTYEFYSKLPAYSKIYDWKIDLIELDTSYVIRLTNYNKKHPYIYFYLDGNKIVWKLQRTDLPLIGKITYLDVKDFLKYNFKVWQFHIQKKFIKPVQLTKEFLKVEVLQEPIFRYSDRLNKLVVTHNKETKLLGIYGKWLDNVKYLYYIKEDNKIVFFKTPVEGCRRRKVSYPSKFSSYLTSKYKFINEIIDIYSTPEKLVIYYN